MAKPRWIGWMIGWLLLAAATAARAQDASPHAIDIPPWFVDTFLDFNEDVAEATREGKRLMVYFGQDGCPYCTLLMKTNFSQRQIVDKTRKHFVAVALNIWGDRETKWTDVGVMSEKALARRLDVQFTPTLLFFDEQGKVAVRLNGYYPPHRFEAVLDYVAAKLEHKEPLAEYLARHARDAASPKLNDEPYFLRPPYDLARKAGGKPLAVMFETPHCAPCDELHRDVLVRPEVQALLPRFDVAQLAPFARAEITSPAGRRVRADAWANELRVTWTPAIVFFDATGVEVFRVDAHLRPFHFASALEYVSTGAYREEPSFQRFIQVRADRMRARGERVDLME
jgi:thioredoxin-related protein